mmetsp:Transcript_23647/g.33030  ORF Transcript_23647/g.33030 Transcript_23647/m.33030 type:complete len:82 (+) Transcript_23647:148-393(+)
MVSPDSNSNVRTITATDTVSKKPANSTFDDLLLPANVTREELVQLPPSQLSSVRPLSPQQLFFHSGESVQYFDLENKRQFQ